MAKQYAIIALHGWTGDASSMLPVSKSIGMKSMEWFFPEGPYDAEPFGKSWYGGSHESGWEVKKSFQILDELLSKILENYLPNQIIFLGFSQGAVFTFHYVSDNMQSFGAAIPIAGFVPEERHFNQANFKKKNDTPFLLLHGEEDEIVKPQGSKDMQKVLEKAGYASNLIYYKGGHKIPLSAIKHIKNFILNER